MKLYLAEIIVVTIGTIFIFGVWIAATEALKINIETNECDE